MWRFATLFFVVCIAATCTAQDSSEHGITPGTKKTNCTCGWANRNFELSGKRIVGGQETEVNEFPMMAGLILRHLYIPGIVDKRNVHFCGGTIVTHRHVVTAGHCIHDQNGNRLKPSEIGLVLGAHDLRKLDYSDPNVMRPPEQLIIHPRYLWAAHYDLAIVVLPYIEFSQIIGPACLPTQRFDVAAKALTVIGWGFITPSGPGSDVLKKTTIIGMSHKQCSLTWGALPPFEKNDPYQVCTYQPGTSQCLGDSGGPIMWVDPMTNRYTLVAAPSYGTQTCHTHPCVSSDISYYEPWIQQVISATYPEEKTCARVD